MAPMVRLNKAGEINNMNPFSRPNAEREVTKLALAPSNPPKEYARGSGDMLRKLLSISENTRRVLSGAGAQTAGGPGEVEKRKPQKREAVKVYLLGDKQRASERHARRERGPDLIDEGVEKARDLQCVEDVIDLVGSEDDVPHGVEQDGDRMDVHLGDEYCPQEEHNAPLKPQTGVALFDVFDEEYEDDEEYADNADHDENEYMDPFSDGNPAPYGLPGQVEGDDWWRKLPDFQPISSIVSVGNRDVRGDAVHVDFLGQFMGTRISSPDGTGAPGGRRSAAATKTGHWETRDGTRTFISAAGTALTGVRAYREYTNGAKRKTTSSKPRRRKKKKTKK